MSHSTNKAPLSSIIILLHQLLDPILDSAPSSSSLTEEEDADFLELDDILNVLDGFAHVELLDGKITRVASQLLLQRQNHLGKGKGKARDDAANEEDMEKLVKLVNRRRGRNGKIGRRGLYFACSMMLRQHFINSIFLITKSPYSPTLIPILQALLPHPSSLPSVPSSPEWQTYLLSLSDEEQERAERWKRMVNGGDRLFLRCVRSGLEGLEVDGDDEEGTDEVGIMITGLEKMEDLLLQLDNHEIASDDDFDASRLPHTPTLHLIATQILKFAYQTNRDKLVLEGIMNGNTHGEAVGIVDLGDVEGEEIYEEERDVKGGNEDVMVHVEERIVRRTGTQVKQEEVDELDEQSADEMMDTEGESSDSLARDQDHDQPMNTSSEHSADEQDVEDYEVRRQQAMQQALERMLAEPGSTWTVLASGDIVKVDLTSLSRPSESPGKRMLSPRKSVTPAPARSRLSVGPSRVVEHQRGRVVEHQRERVISAPSQTRRPRPSFVPQPIPTTPRLAKRRHTEGPSDARQRRAAEVEMLRGGAGDPIGRALEREDSDEGMRGTDEQPFMEARTTSGNQERSNGVKSRHSIAGPPASASFKPRPIGQGYDRPTSTSMAKSRENGSANKRYRPFPDSEVIRSHKKPRAN